MSIPLDRLYNYIEHVANKIYGDVVIYRFFPHGSKKIEDLKRLHHIDWYSSMVLPPVICHDQEPLNFDYYQNYVMDDPLIKLQIKHGCYVPRNLNLMTVYDRPVLMHSEQRSPEVEKYANANFIPCYYWSHAMIAQDWFRFAKHITQTKNVKKTFLIHNRAWAGTREYRLKVVELLHNADLLKVCKTLFNPIDPDTGLHFAQHNFHNDVWKPELNFDPGLLPNNHVATVSANFELQDYETTDIELVLETIFDDSRLHLTEKSLRPIACGQPFILAATHGSLRYLQNYGFKTFSSIWDESYDDIQDPFNRLHRIINLMKTISEWSAGEKKQKLDQAQEICAYNKKHFFSDEFFNLISQEMSDNIFSALETATNTNTCGFWLARRKELCKHKELKDILTGQVRVFTEPRCIFEQTMVQKPEIMKILRFARQRLQSSADQ